MAWNRNPSSSAIAAVLIATAAVLGLAGCSSTTTSAAISGESSAPGQDAQISDDPNTDGDDLVDNIANDADASTFDTAASIVTAFTNAGGVCTDPVDAHLPDATSSLDCAGPAGQTQIIGVFATADGAEKWFRQQVAGEREGAISYLLGHNWAMVAEATSMNIAQTLGVRDQTVTMR